MQSECVVFFIWYLMVNLIYYNVANIIYYMNIYLCEIKWIKKKKVTHSDDGKIYITNKHLYEKLIKRIIEKQQ